MTLSRRRIRAVGTICGVVAATLLLGAGPGWSATQEATASGAVISNGTVSLGVNRTGSLNYDCVAAGDPICPPASAGGVDAVGLRFNALNTDGTAPGCLCEGWGMADAVSGLTGYANEAAGDANITVNSFVVDGTTRAVSDVSISDPTIVGHEMRVVQDYHPSAASPNMYENTVTVTNTGMSGLGDLRYRRVMDWDVEPTAFAEWSTIQGSSPQLLFDSDDGFASSDPLSERSSINSQLKCGDGYTGPCAFKDLGAGGEYPAVTTPDDIGALFDFGFGSLAPGQSKTFRVFYGAAADEPAALAAIGSVGAEVYSIGEPSCPVTGETVGGCETLPENAGVEQGKPNTFIFAFVTTAGDLSITKSDSPDAVLINHDLTYTLTVRNNGPDPVTAVQVSDPLPAGVTHVSTTTTRGTCSGTATISCSLGTMPNGATDTITIVARPTAPGPLSNTASVSSPSHDVNLANNTSTATTTVSPLPTLSISDVSQLEGNSGTTAFVFTVTKSATGHPASVEFATANGTASSGSDYTAATGTVNFAAGEATKTITVLVNGDTTTEPDETFIVALSNPVDATIADSQGQGTIENDDGGATLAIDDVSKAEGNSGITAFTFTVTKSNTDEAATVAFATANGTATQPGDYAAHSGTLDFAAGEATKTVTVDVNGDTTFEANETFVVNLSTPTNATIADSQGQGTIENDDSAPTLAIDNVSNAEGNSGTTAFTFTVTKTGATELPATIGFSTANGTAAQPGDYAAQSGTLSFAPGETSKQVTIAVNGDTTFEADETFTVNLASAANATIADGEGHGTIANDDAAPTLAIDNVSKAEGNSGTTAFTFTVSKTGATELPASVDYATADGTATAPGDYAAKSATLNFAAGVASQQVTVLVNGDTTFEPNETFVLNLSNASGSTIADNQGLGTIQDDDAPTLSINDVNKGEGNAGTSAFIFTVTRDGDTALPATVDFATANGAATQPGDYAAHSGTLDFASGEATKTVTVDVNGDTTFEANETFTVNLTNAAGATIADNQGQGTIENDDAAPTLAIDNVSNAEGTSGTTAFTFTVTKTGATELPATVDFATANGTAAQPGDYAAQSGTLSFAPGETSKQATVLVNGDTTFETDESFTVNLSSASNATIADNEGAGTIGNDDAAPSFAVDNVVRAEGNTGTTAFTFTITKSGATELQAGVNFATADGTTATPADYVAQSGPLTFAAAETSKVLTVLVNGDTTVEPDETFLVNLTAASGATIADNQGQGTIQNDDTATRPPVRPRCVVPSVKNKSVSKARRLLASKHCVLGKVTYARSRKVKKGRIVSQSKRPGTRHPRGTKVNVVVSRGGRESPRRDDD